MINRSIVIVILSVSLLISVSYCLLLSSQKEELITSLHSMTTERDKLSASNQKLKIVSISLASAVNDLNNSIEEAKNYAWATYDEMGYALDNLETR